MSKKSPLPFALLLIFLLVFAMALTGQRARAQEQLSQLFITDSDPTSPPSVVVHAYGRDGQGNPLDLTTTPLTMLHNGSPVTVSADGVHQAGTLTVFLIDIPTGVADQIPAVQDVIKAFASPAGAMVEQVDAVAVYQVGEAEAQQLLEPTIFYNTVQNLFVEDLTPETGATALNDSLGSLITNIDSLKPNADMAASIVVLSDGTDALSSQFQPQDVVVLAGNEGVAVHSIQLNNVELPAAAQEEGSTYLNNLSTGSRGLATTLDNSAEITNIFNRIASFRNQTRLRYTAENLTPGEQQIELSLADDPAVSASTTVTFPENFPSVTLNIPADSRTISIPSLDETVPLQLSATVTWLDGAERSVSAASMLVNGQPIADIPPDQLDSFEVDVTGLTYGDNPFAVAVIDDQGLTVTSPPVPMTVTEGDLSVPESIQASGGFGSILRTLLIALLIVGVLALLAYLALRFLGNRQAKPRRRTPAQPSAAAPAAPLPAYSDNPVTAESNSGPLVMAHLEVLDATTSMPERLNLEGTMVKLGRSPAQSNIAFREDITVSRLHATMMLEGTHYRIFDENSTSGTWVNERQVPEYGLQLNDGDEIHLGAVHLRFRQL